MGRTGCASWRNTSDVRTEVLDSFTGSGTTVLGHKSTSYGRHLWMALERDGVRFVGLCLIEGKAPHITYRLMGEDEEPYYYDCPLSLLALTEPGLSVKWRKLVKEYHDKSSTEWTPGTPVLIGATRYTVEGPFKRSVLVKRDSDGRLFRATRQQLQRA